MMTGIMVHDTPHPGEEAGSTVFHPSSNTSEIRNDKNESRAMASAAAKSEQKHVGQRCGNPETHRGEKKHIKGERHKLKEGEQMHKKHQRQKKNEKANGHPQNS